MQVEQNVIAWYTRCSVCDKQFESVVQAGVLPWVPAHLAPGFGHPCLGMQRVPAGTWRKSIEA